MNEEDPVKNPDNLTSGFGIDDKNYIYDALGKMVSKATTAGLKDVSPVRSISRTTEIYSDSILVKIRQQKRKLFTIRLKP